MRSLKVGDRVRVIANYATYGRQGEVKELVHPYVNVWLDNEEIKYDVLAVARQYRASDLALIDRQKVIPLPLP
jgi:hypothetical protein